MTRKPVTDPRIVAANERIGAALECFERWYARGARAHRGMEKARKTIRRARALIKRIQG